MNGPGFSLNDIERGALSSAMQSAAALAEVVGFLSPEHFANFANRVIFTELAKYWESGKPYDLILFTAHLSAQGLLEKIGGAAYVREVDGFAPTAAAVKYYIGILDDEYDKRRAADICNRTVQAIKQGRYVGNLSRGNGT